MENSIFLQGNSHHVCSHMSFNIKSQNDQALNSFSILCVQVQNPKALWSYLDDTLLPFAYDGRTSKSDPDLEGYASEKNLYVVGMPRLRQLRVKKGKGLVLLAYEKHSISRTSLFIKIIPFYQHLLNSVQWALCQFLPIPPYFQHK